VGRLIVSELSNAPRKVKPAVFSCKSQMNSLQTGCRKISAANLRKAGRPSSLTIKKKDKGGPPHDWR